MIVKQCVIYFSDILLLNVNNMSFVPVILYCLHVVLYRRQCIKYTCTINSVV